MLYRVDCTCKNTEKPFHFFVGASNEIEAKEIFPRLYPGFELKTVVPDYSDQDFAFGLIMSFCGLISVVLFCGFIIYTLHLFQKII